MPILPCKWKTSYRKSRNLSEKKPKTRFPKYVMSRALTKVNWRNFKKVSPSSPKSTIIIAFEWTKDFVESCLDSSHDKWLLRYGKVNRKVFAHITCHYCTHDDSAPTDQIVKWLPPYPKRTVYLLWPQKIQSVSFHFLWWDPKFYKVVFDISYTFWYDFKYIILKFVPMLS